MAPPRWRSLDTALNAIDAPAFVVDLGGEVLHANTNAQVLLDRDRPGVSRSLVAAIAGAPAGGLGSDAAAGQRAAARIPRHHARVPARRSPPGIRCCAASKRWRLTARQTQVLHWVAHGLTNVLIAETLGITEGTVEFHVKSIFDKAGVESRAMLIVKLLEG